jgi:hypothetical protein
MPVTRYHFMPQVLLSVLLCALSCAKVVMAAGPRYPPLHWYDGKRLHGASIALATRILDDRGVAWT